MSDAAERDWWFGEDDLFAPAIESEAQWSKHPFDALEFGKGLMLYRRDRNGAFEQRDAAGLLTFFACHEASQLLHLWAAPEVVRQYLSSADIRLSEKAAAAIQPALSEAYVEIQNAAELVKAAEARCPKLGFFSRAATRAAAWEAAKDYAQAVVAHRHRIAVMHAIGAALFATVQGTCEGARSVADEVINAAGLLAAEEGVIVGSDGRQPQLLPLGVSQATGKMAAIVNIRSRFELMVDHLFG